MPAHSWNFDSLFAAARAKNAAGVAAAIKAVDDFGEMVLGRAGKIAPFGGGSHSPRDPHPGFLSEDSQTATPAVLEGEKVKKRIGFNAVYAAVQHENLDFGHDQGQAKYMETAINESKADFAEFVADRVKRA